MDKTKIPKVALAKPAKRPYQLRYTCLDTKKQIRITTGTHDESEAIEHKSDLEAKLRLGLDTRPRKRAACGANMPWEEFLDRYTGLQLSSLRKKTSADAQNRLGLMARIVKPKRLGDMADSETLHDLQARLLAGESSRFKRPRSAHTVKTNMATLLAALNWAEFMGWLPAVPKVRKVKVSKLRHMKGRPIAGEEFERMLAVTEAEVGPVAAESWRYVLRGLWESALRLDELLHVSWDDPTAIMPAWNRGSLPVLLIPADQQKNDTDESIPLLPGFESLLNETPGRDRHGWAFNPLSLQEKKGRKAGGNRLQVEWIGKTISRIGKRANVVVQPAKKGGPAKYASAHDLRRSCADRLIEAGVPERDVQRVLRHASAETTRRHYSPGTVQRSASVIRQRLESKVYPEKSGYTRELQST